MFRNGLNNLMELNLAKSNVAIVGATGDIGSICSKILAKYFSQVTLIARDYSRLEILKDSMLNEPDSTNDIRIERNLNAIVNSSDVILTVTSSLTTLIEPKSLKAGSILCDVSYPANINMQLASKRSDVLVFEGGLAQANCFDHFDRKVIKKISLFTPPGFLHGCLAETMLLTFEGLFENYSLGRGNITPERIAHIRNLAIKYGFHISTFLSGSRIFLDKDIKDIVTKVRR